MSSEAIHLPIILVAAFMATASPGPSTMATAATAMSSGRVPAYALVAGILTGSLTWSLAAAFGLGAVMLAHAWLFEAMRYAGAAYLLYLAVLSGRAALRPGAANLNAVSAGSLAAFYGKGLAMHLSNPKVILFFGALYSVGIPRSASVGEIAFVVAAVWMQSIAIFTVYATLFSLPRTVATYARIRRWFEGAFAAVFAYAGVRLLFAKLV